MTGKVEGLEDQRNLTPITSLSSNSCVLVDDLCNQNTVNDVQRRWSKNQSLLLNSILSITNAYGLKQGLRIPSNQTLNTDTQASQALSPESTCHCPLILSSSGAVFPVVEQNVCVCVCGYLHHSWMCVFGLVSLPLLALRHLFPCA